MPQIKPITHMTAKDYISHFLFFGQNAMEIRNLDKEIIGRLVTMSTLGGGKGLAWQSGDSPATHKENTLQDEIGPSIWQPRNVRFFRSTDVWCMNFGKTCHVAIRMMKWFNLNGLLFLVGAKWFPMKHLMSYHLLQTGSHFNYFVLGIKTLYYISILFLRFSHLPPPILSSTILNLVLLFIYSFLAMSH